MDWQLISHYIVAVMVLPLIVVTVRNVVKNSSTLFDDDLTAGDRTILKQFALFLLLPLVVLFHEMGHALVAKFMGVDVTAFHWSVFFGQVDVSGDLTPMQDFWIALAGNVFQLIAMLFCLTIAIFSRSPAIVALNIYVYLFAGFSGLIFYPVLSIVSWNHDFSMIYGSEERQLAMITGALHIILIGLFAWTYLSEKSRLWFARKTRPVWAKEYDKVLARVKADPSAVNMLSQAWQFYFVGLEKSAEETLDKVEDANKDLKEVWLLRGYLNQSKGRYKSAVLCFEQITNAQVEDKSLMARAWMARGHCLAEELENTGGGKEKSKAKDGKDYYPILMSYKQACSADAMLADPHYYLGVTLTKAGQSKDAEAELELCQNYAKRGLSWLDPILATFVREAVADNRQPPKSKP
ncbi:MAG: M50 family metallopeptidase [Cyanobacteria bacterium SZAS LIN-2]|nr:M50 family metallopeptidase [Cyanobacteria bacterium SZAS LIN-3]MBS1997225.1 M50 family metallopeptidase [Cyanobacteria bacterium SZAS LIN-2]MBS2006526.1 M50 family metallopeptidase [Cyanobacteria bacterium SZAS TMP-1]